MVSEKQRTEDIPLESLLIDVSISTIAFLKWKYFHRANPWSNDGEDFLFIFAWDQIMVPSSRKRAQVVARRLFHSVKRGIYDVLCINLIFQCYVPVRGLRFFLGTRISPLGEDSTPRWWWRWYDGDEEDNDDDDCDANNDGEISFPSIKFPKCWYLSRFFYGTPAAQRDW